MDTAASTKFLFIFLLSYTFMLCSSGSFLSRRVLGRRELMQTTQDDPMNPPFPASPVTNPVTTPATGTYPPDGLTPPLVTVPSANSGPIPPATDPTINPAVPIPPATDPTTNPAGPLPPATNPTMNPPFPAVGPPATGGQSWCVARSGAAETVIQVALDYACGMGGADCSGIQQGGACYNPNSLQSHASYAFNSYYQKNPMPTSCDFGGAAMLTNVNPSSGSCVFPTSSSSSATVSPTTTGSTPMMPTPGTDFSAPGGVGTPPALMNASNPALGGGIAGYGETPTASISSASATTAGFIACIALSLSVILMS